MKDLPNPFWALCFMILGCLLLTGVLIKVNLNTTTVMLGVLMAIVTAGSNLVSGAFGYINGYKMGANSIQVPDTPPGTTTTAASTVTVGPTPPLATPVAPDQPK